MYCAILFVYFVLALKKWILLNVGKGRKKGLISETRGIVNSLVVQYLGCHASTAGGHRFHPLSGN